LAGADLDRYDWFGDTIAFGLLNRSIAFAPSRELVDAERSLKRARGSTRSGKR